ncbi:MAG: amino acid transporter [Cyanobacteria bacterium HKST-UBA02]|nr:amino acid transporter [Cyanobacteria bacterium HKST-UBA02]
MTVGAIERRSMTFEGRTRRWFLEGLRRCQNVHPSDQDSWWKVMCLTGGDYFSTLGYLPGIAFLSAGFLSPFATLIVVLVTLFGLVPLYSRVAKASPHGQGSIAMLESLLPGWRGKSLILLLLGFVATDFIITITLSAADATAHIVENPLVPVWLTSRVGVTLIMLLVLGAIFLKGFREAIGLAVGIVSLYLILNTVVIARCLGEIAIHPAFVSHWYQGVFGHHTSIWGIAGISLILFPKLALGMSGFETGVSVMPHVKGDPGDSAEDPAGRVRNTRKLLLTAAIVMAGLLLTTSFITATLIPAALFAEGGAANGRALAYLAHKYLGDGFGSIYDTSTILILWFAGASAMAGLMNLVPRYLPRYGMAPDWARAQRPLVVVFTMIACAVTLAFRADVDAQAGAYATGVLVLFTASALAVTLSVWKESYKSRLAFTAILAIFAYTSVANIIERPEGLHIASLFILAIFVTSLISRAIRSYELRVHGVELDETASKIIDEVLESTGRICLLSRRPGGTDYLEKETRTREIHKLNSDATTFIFLEVTLTDPSDFADEMLDISGRYENGCRVLACDSQAIPNAIAALLLELQRRSGTIPHVYFGWTEGHPLTWIFKYIFLGEGETATVTREILRKVQRDPAKRPRVLVG